MKTLISWIAHHNDFENGNFKPNGPTASFHKYFFKHERHILLSGEQDEQNDNRANRARAWLKVAYPDREIEVRAEGKKLSTKKTTFIDPISS